MGVTTAHFLGGDRVGFSLELPFEQCLGSTSTIYPLIIEEVESTASLALLRPLLFQFSVRVAWPLTSVRVPVLGEGRMVFVFQLLARIDMVVHVYCCSCSSSR